MESLKPILLLLVLIGVGYGAYVALNHAPPPEPPISASESPRQATSTEPSTAGHISDTPPANPSTTTTPSTSWNTSVAPEGTRTKSPAVDSTSAAPASASATYNTPTASSGGMSSLPFGIGSADGAAASSATAPGQYAAPTNETMPAAASSSALTAAQTTTPPAPSAAMSENLGTNEGNSSPSVGLQGSAAENDAQAKTRRDYEASWRAAQTDLNQGKLVDALRELSRWYDQTAVPPEEQSQLVDLLGELAGTVIYSRKSYLGPPYVVRAGESLESIARDCQVPWQLLAKINGLSSPNGLIPGQELKILRGPFEAQLNAKGQWLALFVDGLYAGRFRVQCDAPLNKPDGTYPVVKFSANAAAGGLNATASPYISLGGDLHLCVSTDAAAPPGQPVVRISPQDMGDVYDILSDRSEVIIRR